MNPDPFVHLRPGQNWTERGRWPAFWIGCPGAEGQALGATDAPFVVAYRLRFTVQVRERRAVIHVSADERYELFLDGERIGRGPERGDPHHWRFESYRLALAPGRHVLVARVWALGSGAPLAQLSVRPGFLCAADGPWHARLTSGYARWEAKPLGGWGRRGCGVAWGAGDNVDIDGTRIDWGVERGAGTDWRPAHRLAHAVAGDVCNEYGAATHPLEPSTLPAQRAKRLPNGRVRHVDHACGPTVVPVLAAEAMPGESARWQAFLDGAPIVVAPGACYRVVIDLEAYRCAYPEVTVSGGEGSSLRLAWSEGLFDGVGEPGGGGAADGPGKGNRNEIEGKRFLGNVADVFHPDGGRHRRFGTLWWQAGRYLELQVVVGDHALTVERLALTGTGYPLRRESSFGCDEPRWKSLAETAWRTLESCAHETFMDCPYYEQLQYVGDTRLQALVVLAWTRDDRLVRQALRQFDASRLPDRGFTASRYPSRGVQIIPPFSLWWVAMVHDHAAWRGDRAFAAGLMPGVRSVLETVLTHRRADGLIAGLNGWNFTDWVPAWTATTRDRRNWGVPPDGVDGASAVLCWQTVGVLRQAAELEAWLGQPELAARWRREADGLGRATDAAFWVSERGLYADDCAHRFFSEHSQALAILSGQPSAAKLRCLARGLSAGSPDLQRTTVYFSHYLFEALARLGTVEPCFRRLRELWFPMLANGLRTTSEEPEPSRSDCHAWGAHPLYHALATVLGIRPDGLGSGRVVIRPQLGPLHRASGSLTHPCGPIRIELTRGADGTHGHITLPAGLSGTLILGRLRLPLTGGSQFAF